jgi:hypothetical protein
MRALGHQLTLFISLLQLCLFLRNIIYAIWVQCSPLMAELLQRGGQRSIDGFQVLHPQIHREIDLAASAHTGLPQPTPI